uniref:Uncharacterized protein n=1 Tax=Rhizophora mucronata TaxID=61149 RepID=A0A2P2ISS3_RHIMU
MRNKALHLFNIQLQFTHNQSTPKYSSTRTGTTKMLTRCNIESNVKGFFEKSVLN